MSHTDASRESLGAAVDPSRSYPDGTKALTPPLSSLSLETLARLARAAKDPIGAKLDPMPWFSVEGLVALGFDRAFAEFIAEATPERILGLIGAAQQGAEDSARLDWLAEHSDDAPEPNGRNHRGEALWAMAGGVRVGGTWRDAIDAARSARRLAASEATSAYFDDEPAAPSPESSDHA